MGTLRGLDKRDAAIAGSEDQPLDLCKVADKYSSLAFESMVSASFLAVAAFATAIANAAKADGNIRAGRMNLLSYPA
jgi:hypothetical protein